MHEASLPLLLATTVSIAVGHTVIGIDHTLPFVALGRARAWSLRKTLLVTALCGLGHVVSSLLLAAVAVGLGIAAQRLEWVQAARGSLSAWLLMAFGGFFILRGLLRARRARAHSHVHAHADGIVHSHSHDHLQAQHVHPHAERGTAAAAVWGLFIVFVLGPCEPLVPLVLAPSALGDWATAALVVIVFAAVTVGAMLALVAIGHVGAARLRFASLERHAELLAGIAIAGSGAAVQWLGI